MGITMTLNDIVTINWNCLTTEGSNALTELASRYLPHLQAEDRDHARTQAWRFMVDFNRLALSDIGQDDDMLVKEVLSEVFDFVFEAMNEDLEMEKINDLFWEAYETTMKSTTEAE